jgi:ABC-type multidrug transport system fused ATPase/permease subunit
MFYTNIICALVVFGAFFWAEPRLTVLVITIFALVSLSTYYSLRRRLDKSGQNAARLAMAGNSVLMTAQKGVREIICFQNQAAFLKAFGQHLQERVPHQVFLNLAPMIPSWLLEISGFVTILITLLYFIKSGAAMPRIVASISLLLLTAWRVLPAVSRAMSATVGIRGQRPQALLCLELLEKLKHSEETAIPESAPDFRFTDRLVLEKAAFRYPTGQSDALADISLTIKKGETIGLIGVSGAGKSTLALLLTGLVEPQAGRFLVDGRALTPAGRSAYARLVGFVPQSPLLLPGTVADNVAFSRWGEKYDRQAVEAACRQAAMDFVFEHPQGLDRPLGIGGQGLSGGQAQRVAIARALFTRPEIIIFDEATSALDQASENLIAETIKSLTAGTTVVIIAHRLTTVENCGRLIWLEDGRVREAGPPAEILPRYRAAMAEKSKE